MAQKAAKNQGRRINERLVSYWESVRGARPFPSEAEIDPEAIAEIWDSCFLVKVGDVIEPRGYKYTYLGVSLIEAYGDDLTDQEVCTRLITPSNPELIDHFQEVARTGKPLTVESQFTNLKNIIIKYRSCMLPLGEKPPKVDYVIGGMKWKLF